MNLIPWRHKRENSNGGTCETHPLARLRDEMDHAFEQFWRDPWSANLADVFSYGSGLSLQVNVAESENDVTVTAELPGVAPEDVDISISENVLTIHGEKKHEKEDKKRNYHYVERSYGSFHRSIQLPSSVDPDKVDATYKNGVLKVSLAKHEKAKPKRITVQHE